MCLKLLLICSFLSLIYLSLKYSFPHLRWGVVHKWRHANLDISITPSPPWSRFLLLRPLYCCHNILYPLPLRPWHHLWTTREEIKQLKIDFNWNKTIYNNLLRPVVHNRAVLHSSAKYYLLQVYNADALLKLNVTTNL